METLYAYMTLSVTVGLCVSRPHVFVGSKKLHIDIGVAAVLGVALMLIGGLLEPADLMTSFKIQWRPLLALTSIMVMTGVVKETGAFERLALRIDSYARETSTSRAFNMIFVASVVTPSLLNNDAAILLLTPVVIAMARRLYPGNDRILEAFVFAVFLAPGVAPFVISNPMNMIVAEYAGIGFNDYTAIMGPISAAGALMTFGILRWHYRKVLHAEAVPSLPTEIPPAHRAERPAFIFLMTVFLAYPVMAALDVPIWSVALAGAIGCTIISQIYSVASPRKIAGHVSLDILFFLWGVFLVVAGLREVGVIDNLAALYSSYDANSGAQLGVIGVVSALGSAVVDNHPMSILNMLAIGHEGATRPLLAALVGGDIGPRLLPIGSLAGLLWMDLLRRSGIEISIFKFVRLGTIVLIPTLTLSLLLLSLW
ncbi:MAG: hypothetical protein KDH09_11095 [Chrysiogenetes bacterium]|nr:hypothetical protein [Chrysiogenetes bacterium]